MLKKINLKMILCGVAVLFGVIAACMLFAPAIKDKFVGEGLSGSKIAFGDKDEMLAASAYMLPLFLAIIGVALAVVAALGKGGKILPIVAAVCFVGAGICYFLPLAMITPDLGDLSGDAKDKALELFREGMKEGCELAAGAIVGGIFSIIAAVAVAVPVFVCKD